MADVINLRSARKARNRAKQAGEADANRAKFGRTKAERAQQNAGKSREDRLLDGAKLERD